MIRCAAICYLVEQNEPSIPFLLELPDGPTKEQITATLDQQFRASFGVCPGERDERTVTVGLSEVGHIQAEGDDDCYVFVTFPPEHESLRSLFMTAKAVSSDPHVRELQEAKRSNNHAEMARLITLLKQKYGANLHKIFRNL